MKITILGSGTSTGVPIIGCECSVCTSSDPKSQRTRAAIFIQTDHQKNIVVDTGPEFRIQMLREKIKRLDAVLFTHLHADHCHGFDDIRAFHFQTKKSIPAYLTVENQKELKTRFHYAFHDTGYAGTKPTLELRAVPSAGYFDMEGVEVETFQAPHGPGLTSVFRFGAFAYATDFKSFTSEQIERWRGKVRVMVASGIHFGSHTTHSTIPETLALFEQLRVERGIITHLSHEVDHLRDGARLPAHVSFAFDGMSVDVG